MSDLFPPLSDLRRRTSAKWALVEPDVLPLWVAELDVSLAPAVTAALQRAVADGDTGYAAPAGLAPAFAGFAARRWGWDVTTERCFPVADVMTGVAEVLKALTEPGDGVVICPPVYHPFFSIPVEAGRAVVPVPLLPDGSLDLAGIDAALADGARAVLLASPHNPTGRVWSGAELDALDQVCGPHRALVLADEIHAPLTLPGATFTPYLRDAGERHAVALVSASKAFNLAGLKAGLVVAGSEAVAGRLRERMAPEMPYRCGIAGVVASVAAWQSGDAWLDRLVAALDDHRTLLADLLREQLPQVRYAPGGAGYLAWLDCRALGLADPARAFREDGRVALVEGSDFGAPGTGFARLNFGTHPDVLAEAVARMARAVAR